MKTFVISDNGDCAVTLWNAKNAEDALYDAADWLHYEPEELQAWTLKEYYKHVLSKPWWILEADGLWEPAKQLGLV